MQTELPANSTHDDHLQPSPETCSQHKHTHVQPTVTFTTTHLLTHQKTHTPCTIHTEAKANNSEYPHALHSHNTSHTHTLLHHRQHALQAPKINSPLPKTHLLSHITSHTHLTQHTSQTNPASHNKAQDLPSCPYHWQPNTYTHTP